MNIFIIILLSLGALVLLGKIGGLIEESAEETLQKVDKEEAESKKVEEKKFKEIRETKCTCEACGNVWFYGKEEEGEVKMNQLQNASKAMMCCGGCLPALFIKDKEIIDLNKCPKCGSRAVKKEIVTHNV